jgi:hypothetical protein
MSGILNENHWQDLRLADFYSFPFAEKPGMMLAHR